MQNTMSLKSAAEYDVAKAVSGPRVFLGEWNVERRIFQRATCIPLVFVGSAKITENSFEETGELHVGEARVPAARNYRLRLGAKEIEIRFPDDRLFISLNAEPAQQVFHRCGDDVYRGRFYVPGPDSWIENWVVEGPRKSYRSIGRFHRAAAAPALFDAV